MTWPRERLLAHNPKRPARAVTVVLSLNLLLIPLTLAARQTGCLVRVPAGIEGSAPAGLWASGRPADGKPFACGASLNQPRDPIAAFQALPGLSAAS